VLAQIRNRRSGRAAPRLLLARSLEQTVAEAWSRPHPSWSATTALSNPRSRHGVRAATAELSSLARALRETTAADAETLRLCRGLISDGFASPLYRGDADALRREAGRLRFRVLECDAA
jgi:hypothetical protein